VKCSKLPPTTQIILDGAVILEILKVNHFCVVLKLVGGYLLEYVNLEEMRGSKPS